MSVSQEGIPANWAIASIGDLILPNGAFVDGDWIESKDQNPNGDVRLIQLADIGDGVYTNRSKRFLTLKRATELGCTFLKAGDVLIARMPEPLGRACIFPGDEKQAVTAVDVCIVRTGLGEDNHRWLMWTINASPFRSAIASLQSGSTRGRISRRNLASLSLPVPPINEQRRIVAEIEKQFERLDEGVASLKRVEEDLRHYRASVLKAACEGSLVLTEAALAHREKRNYEPASVLLQTILKQRRAKWEREQLAKMKAQGKKPKDNKWKERYVEPEELSLEHLSELPEGWTWARAEQVCDFITKGTTPSAIKLLPGHGEIPYIKVYNLTYGGALDFEINPTFISKETHSKELSRSKVIPRDVLMNIVGPPLGKVSIVPDTYKEWNINQAIAVFRPMPSFNYKYLSFLLLTNKILAWAIKRAKTTVGQINLTLEICRDLPLPLPPLSEQKRIVAEVEKRLGMIEELEATVALNLKRAEELRGSILQRAFAGRLASQDPNDEPASILLERIAAEHQRKSEESMKEKKRTPRRKEEDKVVAKLPFAEEKDLLAVFKRKDIRLSIEDAFESGSYNFQPNDGGEYEDVDAFFGQLSELLTQATLTIEREPDQVFLRRMAR